MRAPIVSVGQAGAGPGRVLGVTPGVLTSERPHLHPPWAWGSGVGSGFGLACGRGRQALQEEGGSRGALLHRDPCTGSGAGPAASGAAGV